jgi:hypothetical protein
MQGIPGGSVASAGRVQPQLAVRISAAPSGVRAFRGPVVHGWPVIPGEAGSAPAGGPHVGCSFRCGSGPVVLGGLRFSPSWQCAYRLLLSGAGQVRWCLVGSGSAPAASAHVGCSFRCGSVRVGPGGGPASAPAGSAHVRCSFRWTSVPVVPRSCSAPASGVHIFASFLCSEAMPDLASFSKHCRHMEGLWPVPEYFSCPSPAEVRVDSRG